MTESTTSRRGRGRRPAAEVRTAVLAAAGHLLLAEGLGHVLVDLGEVRALGPHVGGSPWRAAIADPADREKVIHRLDLHEGALATSSPAGFRFAGSPAWHHLFDPATGHPRSLYESVSVTAPDATTADALSTAFTQMDRSGVEAVLAEVPGVRAFLLTPGGDFSRIG